MPTTYASGNGGQCIFIAPNHDLVVVTLGRFYNEPTWAPEDILLRVVGATQ